jgi:hypothetical protein
LMFQTGIKPMMDILAGAIIVWFVLVAGSR